MRIAMCILAISLVVSPVFADNSARIDELTKEGNGLLNARQQSTERIRQIDIRLIEIQGACKELAFQDKPEEVEDVGE